MKVDISKLRPGQDLVDLFRVPEKKDESGWRGPCELLDISPTDNTAIVKHQSQPFIVPIRHIRPHAAKAMFTYMNTPSVFFQMGVYESRSGLSTSTNTYQLLHSLLDRIDSLPPGKLHYQGTFKDNKGLTKFIPEDLLTKAPFELTTASRIGTELLKHRDATGIVFGTQVIHFSLDYLCLLYTSPSPRDRG